MSETEQTEYVVVKLWPRKAILVRPGEDWLAPETEVWQICDPPPQIKIGDIIRGEKGK